MDLLLWKNKMKKTLKINLRELQRDDNKDIIIEIKTQSAVDINEVNVELTGNNVMNPQENHFPVNVEVGNEKDFSEYQTQTMRIIAYEAMFNALDNRDTALNVLKEASQKIVNINQQSQFAYSVVEEFSLLIAQVENGDKSVWKKIIQSAMAHKYQKSVGENILSHENYNTTAKKVMQSRYINREKYAKCHNCGASGHFAKNCNVAEMCHNCKQPGHRAENCPTQSSICHNCKKEGHIMKDCPEKKSNDNACYLCGKAGHFARECTEGKNNGNRGRDSGKRGRDSGNRGRDNKRGRRR